MLYLFFDLEILFRDSWISIKHFSAQTLLMKTKNFEPSVNWVKAFFIFYHLWRHLDSHFGLRCGHKFLWYSLYFIKIYINYSNISFLVISLWKSVFLVFFKKQLQIIEKKWRLQKSLNVERHLQCRVGNNYIHTPQKWPQWLKCTTMTSIWDIFFPCYF